MKKKLFENTVGKRKENVVNHFCQPMVMSNFSFFQSVCKRLVLQTPKNEVFFLGGGGLTILREAALENIVRKGENADYKHLLILSSMLTTRKRRIPRFDRHLNGSL